MIEPMEMVLVTFEGETRASEVIQKIRAETKKEDAIIHRAAVLVKNESGQVRVQEVSDISPAGGAFFGTFLGAIVGLVAGGPAGAVVGGASGAVTGGVTSAGANLGFDERTLSGLKDSLSVNSSAVLIILESKNLDQLNQNLEQYQGKVYQQNLQESLAAQMRKDQENTAE